MFALCRRHFPFRINNYEVMISVADANILAKIPSQMLSVQLRYQKSIFETARINLNTIGRLNNSREPIHRFNNTALFSVHCKHLEV